MIILFIDIRHKLIRFFFKVYAYFFLKNCDIIYLNRDLKKHEFSDLSKLFEAKQELLRISNLLVKTDRKEEFALKYCKLMDSKLYDLVLHSLSSKDESIYYMPMLPNVLSKSTEFYLLTFLGKNSTKNKSIKFIIARFIVSLGFYILMFRNIIKSLFLFFKLTVNLFFTRKSKLVEIGKSPLLWLGVSPTEVSDNTMNLSLQNFLKIITKRSGSIGKKDTNFDSIVAITHLNQKIIIKNSSIYMLKSIFTIRLNLRFTLYFKLFINILYELGNIVLLPLISPEKKLLISNDIDSLIYKYIFEVHNFKCLIFTYSYIFEQAPQLAMGKLSRPCILVNYSSLLVAIPINYRPNEYLLYQIEFGVYNYALTWDQSMIKINSSIKNVFPIGPIMFSTPPPKKIKDYALYKEKLSMLENKVIISLFDITPMNKNMLLLYDGGAYYYNFESVMSFINEVIFSCQEVFGNDFVILMKPKRTPNPKVNNMNYFIELDSIIKSNKNIVLFEPDTNPWHIICLSSLTISIPFTSTANAAHYLGIPSCYYSSKKNIKSLDREYPRTVFGAHELKKWLSNNKRRNLLSDESAFNNHIKVLKIIENMSDVINNIIQSHQVKGKYEK